MSAYQFKLKDELIPTTQEGLDKLAQDLKTITNVCTITYKCGLVDASGNDRLESIYTLPKSAEV